MTKKTKYRLTEREAAQYGFRWGILDVMRSHIYRGYRLMRVTTDHSELEISVSPKGHSIRVWRDGKELT